MIKRLKKILNKLSKKISRKNLYKYIENSINNIEKEEKNLNNIKVLNIGAGGEIETFLKSRFNFVKSIDIDEKKVSISPPAPIFKTFILVSGGIETE